MDLAVCEALLTTRELGQLPVDLLLLRENVLLDLDDARPVLGDLLLDLGPQSDCLFAGAALRFAAKRLSLPMCVLQELLPHLVRTTQAGLPELSEGERGPRSSDDQSDQYSNGDQHSRSWLGGSRSYRDRTRREPANGYPES